MSRFRLAPSSDRLALLGLAALVAAVFHEALSTGRVFFQRDIHAVWYPQVETLVRAVAEGSRPLWNPYAAFGLPLLADPSSQTLYPPTWLNLVMPPAAYYKLFVVLHCLFTAIGVYALARRWGLLPAASFVAAAAWALSGPLLSAASLYHHYAGMAWMPWVLLGLQRVLERPTSGRGLTLGAIAALQVLAGSGDMCLFTAMAAVVYVLVVGGGFALLSRSRLPLTSGSRDRNTLTPLIPPLPEGRGGSRVACGCGPLPEDAAEIGTPTTPQPQPPLRRLAGSLVVALAAALLLSAAQWVPTVAVARHSARVGVPRWVNTYWSLHPASLADLLVPRLVEGFPMNESVRAVVFEGREPLLVSIYLGLPCAALATLGAVAGGPRGRRLALAFVFFLLAALGRYTSVYPLLLHLPAVALFRYPVKYLAAAAPFWALLVAVGVQVWLGAWGAREKRRALVVAAGTAVVAAALLGLGEQVRRQPLTVAPLLRSVPAAAADEQPLADTIARLRTAAASALAAAALLAARARAGPRPWLTAALLALASADLVSAGAAVNPLAPPELMWHRPPLLQKLPPEERVFAFPYPILWLNQQLSRGPAGWKKEWSWALGSIEQLQPPSGARWRVYGSFDGDFTGLAAPMTSVFGAWVQRGGPLALRLLQMGGVGYVVALPPPPIPGVAEVGEWPSVFREPIRLLQVSAPLPRAYAVDGARVATEPASFDVLADPGFDPRSEVILPAGLPRGPAAGFSSSVRVAWRRADEVGIEAELSRPGHVLLLEAYDAGWRAAVDGQPAEVLRANVLFRAVAVPAGRHVVTFRYRPPAVVAGFVVSALTLAAGLVLVAFRRLIAPQAGDSIQAFRMDTPTPADRPGPSPTKQA